MNVLLVHPPVTLGRNLFNAPPLSGLGTLYTAGFLRARGHAVTVVDAFLLPEAVPPRGRLGQTATLDLGGDYPALTAAVLAHDGPFDAILVSKARFWEAERGPLFRAFLAALRERWPQSLLGLADHFIGDLYLPPYDPCDYLRLYPALDLVLHGVGESAVARLLAAPRAEWRDVPGLAYRTAPTDGATAGCQFNGFHYDDETLQDLDTLPFLAYDLVGAAAYKQFFLSAEAADFVQESHEGEPFLALLASRGCNHRCRFCAMPDYRIRYRAHSIDYLEAQFIRWFDEAGVRKFILNDPAINMNREFFKRFLRMMAARGFRFLAPSGVRADRVDAETLALLKGTTSAVITALETPDPDFARAHVHKGLDPEKVVTLVTDAAALNLPTKVHYVVGMPGETIRTVNQTLATALALWDAQGAAPLVQIATPIPGCAMYREAAERGLLELAPSEIAAALPDLFQSRSVMSTPDLPSATVTRMFQRFERYVLREHPREVMIPVTFACNNKCYHCMFADGCNRPVTLAEVRAEAIRAHDAGITTMVFEGGEPTLHKDFLEMVRAARDLGMREVMVETNARRAAYLPYAESLAQAGVTMMGVTLHGPDPLTHDAVTGVAGSYAQSLQGIANLRNCGFADLMLNLPLHRSQLEGSRLEDTLRIGLGLGITVFMVQHLTPFGRLGGERGRLPGYAEVLPVVRPLVQRYARRTRLRVSNLPPCLLRGLEPVVHPDVNNIGHIALDPRQAPVGIAAALAHGKVKDDLCPSCEWGFLCTGFVPEPPRVGVSSLAEL